MRRAVLAAVLLLAGCVGPEEAPLAPAANESAPGPEEPATDVSDLPAYRETNRTEEGLGGEAHAHDYWRGKTRIVVFDGPLDGILWVFPRQDTSRVAEAYAVLTTVPDEPDHPALVYEGTGLVEFTLTSSPPWADTFRVSYRTAARDWSEPVPLKVGETLAVEPDERDVDTPHAVVSQWAWRVEAVGPVPVTQEGGVTGQGRPTATVAVSKAREPAVWPGHPDLYADGRPRVVLEGKAGRTDAVLAPAYTAFGPDDAGLVPERLVATGTRTLDVFANVTRLEATAPVSSFTLQWRSAGTRPDAIGTFVRSNETDGATWATWRLAVNETMVDSPYQPTSRWTFQVWANTDLGRTYCWSCLPYTLEYTLTVVAGPGEGEAP